MNKVQLTLSNEETAILAGYGNQFGYSLPRTLRFVISKAAEKFLEQGTVPIFEMSDKTEAAGLKALKEQKAGKAIAVDNVDKFFDEL